MPDIEDIEKLQLRLKFKKVLRRILLKTAANTFNKCV